MQVYDNITIKNKNYTLVVASHHNNLTQWREDQIKKLINQL